MQARLIRPVCAENSIPIDLIAESLDVGHDGRPAMLLFEVVGFTVRSKSRLEAENATLEASADRTAAQATRSRPVHQQRPPVLHPAVPLVPSILEAIMISRPETLVRWHRAGFRRYWRWKSRNLGGRPPIDAGLRALIRRMSVENLLWGVRRAFVTSCSSSVLRWLSRPSPSTWSGQTAAHPVRAGAPSCATICRRSRPWSCSLSRPSASSCSTLWSLSGWLGVSLLDQCGSTPDGGMASAVERDRNRPINAHQINQQTSLISSKYQPIRGPRAVGTRVTWPSRFRQGAPNKTPRSAESRR